MFEPTYRPLRWLLLEVLPGPREAGWVARDPVLPLPLRLGQHLRRALAPLGPPEGPQSAQRPEQPEAFAGRSFRLAPRLASKAAAANASNAADTAAGF